MRLLILLAEIFRIVVLRRRHWDRDNLPSGLEDGVRMDESQSKDHCPSWRVCLEGELLLL